MYRCVAISSSQIVSGYAYHCRLFQNYTRVSQMKTLNIFLNTIYCAEVVQSCINFQHNLPHAQ